MPIFPLGSEVLIIPPLPTAAGQCGQGEQDGLPQLWQHGQAEVPEDPPEEPLCWYQNIHIYKLQDSNTGDLYYALLIILQFFNVKTK